MEQMYRKHLFKCSYETLKFEAESHFETTDPRVIEKYIGRLRGKTRYAGSTVVRQNVNGGKIAQFRYMNERTIEAKKGLTEVLGLITREGDRYVLHHERLSYFTVQTELANSVPEAKENSESTHDLCVSPIKDSHKGKGKGRKTICEGVPSTVTDVEEGMWGEIREREVIEHTHKSDITKDNTKNTTVLQLRSSEDSE